MKIIYKEDHLSISKFNTVEAPNLMVLTGMNGSGKSHLLEAIVNKKVVVEGFESDEAVYFNYQTFALENESIFNALNIASDRTDAWNLFLQRFKNNIQSWKNNLMNNNNSYEEITKICIEKNKSLWALTKGDFTDVKTYDLLQAYKKNIINLFNQTDLKNNHQAQGILVLIKKLNYSIDEIDEYDFKIEYRPFNFKNDFLPYQLGRIFWDYFIRLRENEIKLFEKKEKSIDHIVLTDEEFKTKYGDKPWDVINTILENFNSLDFKITSPEKYSYLDNYQLKLFHSNKKIKLDFNNLSSGERVLMALVASIYKVGTDAHFPSVLLLENWLQN